MYAPGQVILVTNADTTFVYFEKKSHCTCLVHHWFESHVKQLFSRGTNL